VAGDDLPGLPREEAVALGVVGLVPDEGREQAGQVRGIHLRVAGHHGHDARLGSIGQGRLVSGGDGRAHPAVLLVADHLQALTHPPRRPAQDLFRAVAGGIVHDHDAVHERGHGLQDGPEQLLLVVGRHDDDDSPALEHDRLFYLNDPEGSGAGPTS
jgi:hypothetical protein